MKSVHRLITTWCQFDGESSHPKAEKPERRSDKRKTILLLTHRMFASMKSAYACTVSTYCRSAASRFASFVE
ncbi:MAG: hypothetical protein ACYSU4_12350 [Planctomycetota bacterium]